MSGRAENVILWQNGVVMVFDDEGEQMGELQGMFPRVEAKLALLPEDGILWQRGVWLECLTDVTKADLMRGPL